MITKVNKCVTCCSQLLVTLVVLSEAIWEKRSLGKSALVVAFEAGSSGMRHRTVNGLLTNMTHGESQYRREEFLIPRESTACRNRR